MYNSDTFKCVAEESLHIDFSSRKNFHTAEFLTVWKFYVVASGFNRIFFSLALFKLKLCTRSKQRPVLVMVELCMAVWLYLR